MSCDISLGSGVNFQTGFNPILHFQHNGSYWDAERIVIRFGGGRSGFISPPHKTNHQGF